MSTNDAANQEFLSKLNFAAAFEYMEKAFGPTDVVDRHYAALREWARGRPPVEAAVEMLIRGFRGQYATGWPWIASADLPADPDRPAWVRSERRGVAFPILANSADQFPPRVRAYLKVAAALGSQDPEATVTIADLIAVFDRGEMDLVLAGIAHAAGFAKRIGTAYNPQTGGIDGSLMGYSYTPPLWPWPDPDTRNDVPDPEKLIAEWRPPAVTTTYLPRNESGTEPDWSPHPGTVLDDQDEGTR